MQTDTEVEVGLYIRPKHRLHSGLSPRLVTTTAYAGMVWKWLRKQSPVKAETVLRGGPARPRLKTYSADSGYVYQYVYRGHRGVETRDGVQTKEYVFSVTRDRKTYFPVVVMLAESVLAEWSKIHQRELSETELYAIVKLSLFEAFDQRDEIQALALPIELNVAVVHRQLDALGRL